tara:strand:+ start:538 stop:666 length:129 start_codon:yes stop_codon:yes gene_type:complete
MGSVDLSTGTIQDLFMKQITDLTKKTAAMESFDVQFSDRWLR